MLAKRASKDEYFRGFITTALPRSSQSSPLKAPSMLQPADMDRPHYRMADKWQRLRPAIDTRHDSDLHVSGPCSGCCGPISVRLQPFRRGFPCLILPDTSPTSRTHASSSLFPLLLQTSMSLHEHTYLALPLLLLSYFFVTMDTSPHHDSPYADEHTTTRDNGKQPSTSNFEAEAAKIRARMPYRPPSPSDAPLARDTGISAFTNGLPPLVRDAPSSRMPNQMSREGPRPRAPGETRDPDFYERLTPSNQKLFKLYGTTALFGLIGFASVIYTAWNIHFMKIFSPKAKEVMLDVYGLNGYGGMAIVVRAYSFLNRLN